MQNDLWQKFLDNRDGLLWALGEAVLEGVVRNDNAHHPVFHGSYDWHSCIAGCYALTVLYRLTGEYLYIDTINALLDPQKLELECGLLDEGRITPEIPEGYQHAWFYGYSWLLRFATEYERATGGKGLRPLAQKAADKLAAHIFNLSQDDIDSCIVDPEYKNLSWKALNLWRWAQARRDEELSSAIRNFARERFVRPLQKEDRKGFFSPSLMRADAALTILPEAQNISTEMLCDMVPLCNIPSLQSIKTAQDIHIAGLNFTRAGNLYALYRQTGNLVFRDDFSFHLAAQFNQKESWSSTLSGVFNKTKYDYYGHWVPQLGIEAIQRSYEVDLCCMPDGIK